VARAPEISVRARDVLKRGHARGWVGRAAEVDVRQPGADLGQPGVDLGAASAGDFD
jgi:hypothetical protein